MMDQVIFDAPALPPDTADALAHARLGDPFSALGPHDTPQGRIIRAYVPGARGVDVIGREDGRFIGSLLPGEPLGLVRGPGRHRRTLPVTCSVARWCAGD